MALSLDDIKLRLPHGAVTRIARQLDCTVGHVSQVVSGRRTSPRVAKSVAKVLGVKLADLPKGLYERSRGAA